MSEQTIVNLSRRRFLQTTVGASAGLTLGVYFPALLAATQAGPGKTAGAVAAGTFEPNAFVRIDADNTVRVVIKHLEIGQGTFTGLSTLVAEELDADWAQIVPEAAPRLHGELVKLGIEVSQATVGNHMICHRKPSSQSRRTFFDNHVQEPKLIEFFYRADNDFPGALGLPRACL